MTSLHDFNRIAPRWSGQHVLSSTPGLRRAHDNSWADYWCNNVKKELDGQYGFNEVISSFFPCIYDIPFHDSRGEQSVDQFKFNR